MVIDTLNTMYEYNPKPLSHEKFLHHITVAQEGRRNKLKKIWEEWGGCPYEFDQTWWDALVAYWLNQK
jgi:hypothetical protein